MTPKKYTIIPIEAFLFIEKRHFFRVPFWCAVVFVVSWWINKRSSCKKRQCGACPNSCARSGFWSPQEIAFIHVKTNGIVPSRG